MRAHFGLPSVSNEEDKKDKPPITVKFEIPYFTVSGIQVPPIGTTVTAKQQCNRRNHRNHPPTRPPATVSLCSLSCSPTLH